MLRTPADAIGFLQAAGISASRRDCALGDTIGVPLGHPSTRDGIAVHPAVAWLVPEADSWTILQAVDQFERKLSFPTLRQACDFVLLIASAFAVFRNCHVCNASAPLAFGERPRSAEFWVAVRCAHCGTQIESDDAGSLPDDLRALELTRNGTWSVLVARPTETRQWTALRHELRLDLPGLATLKGSLPGPVFAGTFAEASRLCASLSKVISVDLLQAG